MKWKIICLLIGMGVFTACNKYDCKVSNTESEVLIHDILQNTRMDHYEDGAFIETLYNQDTIKGENTRYSIDWEIVDTILNTRIVNKKFSFIPSAYACPASIAGYTLMNKVDSFSIKTIQDLDSNYNAGEDVGDLYTINNHKVSDFNASIVGLMNYDYWIYEHDFSFALTEGSYFEGRMQFEITMHLEDGKKIIRTSKQVIRLD